MFDKIGNPKNIGRSVSANIEALVAASARKHGGINHPWGSVVMMEISPELASEILSQLNDFNVRAISQEKVTQYSRDMISGGWSPNFDPIIFVNGQLRNGQHRLSAVVRSGVSQTVLIVWNADERVDKGTDIGKKRTIKTTHDIDTNARAAVFLAHFLSTGKRLVTHSEISRAYESTKDVVDLVCASLKKVRSLRRRSFAGAFIVALGHTKGAARLRVLELIDELISFDLTTDGAKLIAKLGTEGHGVNFNEASSMDEAQKVLRGIHAHIENEPLKLLKPGPHAERYFLRRQP